MVKKAIQPIIGAHISGGMKTAVPKALNITAETIQIFLGSPQMWREPNPSDADKALFMSGVKTNSIKSVFVHGNYLVNLASDQLKISLNQSPILGSPCACQTKLALMD